MYVGVIVELKAGQFSYYFGREGEGIPSPSGTFPTKAAAEEALQAEFDRVEQRQPQADELEFIKENEAEDSLPLLKNLFE